MNAAIVLSLHGTLEDIEKKHKGDFSRIPEFLLFKHFSDAFDKVFVFSADSADRSSILPSNFVHKNLNSGLIFFVFGWIFLLYNILKYDIRIVYAECGPALPPLFMINKLTKAKTLLNYDNTLFLTAHGTKRRIYKIIDVCS